MKIWSPDGISRPPECPLILLVAGGLLGLVGFFVVPVVGLVVGFVLGVYYPAEHRRVGREAAEPRHPRSAPGRPGPPGSDPARGWSARSLDVACRCHDHVKIRP